LDPKSIIKKIVKWFRDQTDEESETSEVIPLSPLTYSYEGFNGLENYLKVAQERKAMFRDYQMMDEMSPEVNRALDIYADNAIYGQSADKSFTVDITEGSTPEIEDAIAECDEKTQIHDRCWGIARDIVKFGEDFEEMVCSANGLVKLKFLPAGSMWVDVDKFGKPVDKDQYFLQRNDSDKVVASWPEEDVLHFKIEGDRKSPYGRSLLYAARRLFRQIHLMEDSMVIARARRAHARYVFNVDTGNLQLEQKLLALDNYKKRHMTRRMVDQATGNVRTEDVPLRVEEDIYVGSGDKVDLLQGDISVTHIADVQYFLGKMYTALGVPKAFMARDETVNAKATLTQQDIQFARSVKRVQIALKNGLKKMYKACLIAKGIDPTGVKIEIKFPQMNVIDVLMTWEIMQIKGLCSGILRDDLQMFPTDWLYDNVFELTEKEKIKVKEMLAAEEAERTQKLLNSPLVAISAAVDPKSAGKDAALNMGNQGVSRDKVPSPFPGKIKTPDTKLNPRFPEIRIPDQAKGPVGHGGYEAVRARLQALREHMEANPETAAFVKELSMLLDYTIGKDDDK
jgi:hypothetical protein